MEGYEIYRLSDEEIQHVGVKGMKWGKRKSRSAYMKKVDAHENKTKAVAAAKSESGKAKRKAYMDAVNAHEKKGQDIASAKSKEKSDKKAINEKSKAAKQISPEEFAARKAKRQESLKKAGEAISYFSKVIVTASIDDQIRNEISDPTLQEYAKAGARARIDEAWGSKLKK